MDDYSYQHCSTKMVRPVVMPLVIHGDWVGLSLLVMVIPTVQKLMRIVYSPDLEPCREGRKIAATVSSIYAFS